MTPEEFARIRKRLQLSKRELARQIGMSVNTISNYEFGKRKIPNYIAMLMRGEKLARVDHL